MSIKIERPSTAKEILELLSTLATCKLDFVFRGHHSESYRLQSTLHRFLGRTIVDDKDKLYDRMLHKFETGLARIGKLPTEIKTRQDRLEYARHYDLPSPCIDFSYSPYIALYFALNGLMRDEMYISESKQYAAVYAISMQRLTHQHAILQHQTTNRDYIDIYKGTMFPHGDEQYFDKFFKDGYPADKLQFIPLPAKFNTRMQRQCGCFIFDTLDYNRRKLKDLEDYIEIFEDPKDTSETTQQLGHQTLIKILIPKREAAGELFEHLELMGILGGHLFDSPEGVARDVANSCFYNSKTLFSRNYYEQE